MALAAGAIAIAIVSVDLAFTFSARLEARDASGQWVLVSQAPEPVSGRYEGRPFPRGPGDCPGRDMRLVVENTRPFSDRVDVLISYEDPGTGRTRTFFTGDWALKAFETRTQEFRVPDEAFPAPTPNNSRPAAQINLSVGDLSLFSCVDREA